MYLSSDTYHVCATRATRDEWRERRSEGAQNLQGTHPIKGIDPSLEGPMVCSDIDHDTFSVDSFHATPNANGNRRNGKLST